MNDDKLDAHTFYRFYTTLNELAITRYKNDTRNKLHDEKKIF